MSAVPWKHSRWGLQVLMDKVGVFEIWETIPHRNHYGGVMRKVGEQIEVDNVIYTVHHGRGQGGHNESEGERNNPCWYLQI